MTTTITPENATACGLRNPNARNSGHVNELSFIDCGETVWVVTHMCAGDQMARMTRTGARECYRRNETRNGFLRCEPLAVGITKESGRLRKVRDLARRPL
ncbi:MAG: hypothetical protein O7A04_03460 [Acidobacteria bacterium]|nr:hypothetical protein [Acidobacteriota bacterium]